MRCVFVGGAPVILEVAAICFITLVIFFAKSLTLLYLSSSSSWRPIGFLRKLLRITRLMLLKFFKTESLGYSASLLRNVSKLFIELRVSVGCLVCLGLVFITCYRVEPSVLAFLKPPHGFSRDT